MAVGGDANRVPTRIAARLPNALPVGVGHRSRPAAYEWAGTLALEPAAAGPAATTAKVAGATEHKPRGDATPPGNVASTAQRGSIRCGTQVPASSGVFGITDARPLNRRYSGDPTQGDGMDVSPALNGCLGFNDPDGDNDHVNWQFVDAPQVSACPPGQSSSRAPASPNSQQPSGDGRSETGFLREDELPCESRRRRLATRHSRLEPRRTGRLRSRRARRPGVDARRSSHR